MRSRHADSGDEAEEEGRLLTRRLWLQGAGLAAVGASAPGFSPGVNASPQAPALPDVIRAMTLVTGGRIEENWIGPTASLVGIILDSSKGLRQLDLGEIEPPIDSLAD
jgi:hypothetical protein